MKDDVKLNSKKQEPKSLLIHSVNKLMTFKRYMRKKAFKIQDLVAYIKRTEKDALDREINEDKEMMYRVRPLVQAKISYLISDRVNRMHNMVIRQNWKIEKLS